MGFKSLKKKSDSIQLFKLFGIFTITAAFVFVGFVLQNFKNNLIVIDTNGQEYESLIVNEESKTFFKYHRFGKKTISFFYNYLHNNVKTQIDRGLENLDKESQEYVLGFLEKYNVLTSVENYRLSSYLEILEYDIDMGKKPVAGYLIGRQVVVKGSTEKRRNLKISFCLYPTHETIQEEGAIMGCLKIEDYVEPE